MRSAALSLLIALAFLLAPRFGAQGMVWAHVLGGLAALGFGLWLVRRALAPGQRVESGSEEQS